MTDRRVALITGAASGIGAACALWFAERECNILVNYRSDAEGAEKVAEQCRALGADTLAEQGDVGDDGDCRRLAESAQRRWGGINFLVNSAGTTVFRPMADLEAVDAQDFAAIYATNVIGAYQMVRAVRPHMRAEGDAIVNISSIAGLNGTGSSYPYAASKGALNTLTLALARTLAPTIRVNAVLPGMVQGQWLLKGLGEQAYGRVRDQFAQNAPLATVATPEQVAATVGWIALEGRLMTGQLIPVDAGLLLGAPPKVG